MAEQKHKTSDSIRLACEQLERAISGFDESKAEQKPMDQVQLEKLRSSIKEVKKQLEELEK